MARIARYGAYAIGALALIVLAAALVLPELLDRPSIAAQLQARLSRAVQGEVRWQEFDLRLLPTPQGRLRGLKFKTAVASVSADEVDAALRLWPLLHGRVEIDSLTLARPVIELSIVPAAAVPSEARLAPAQDPLQAYRSAISPVADLLREFAPDTTVAIENADVSVRVEGLPPGELTGLALRARTTSEGVELQASAKSRYWTEMKLAGRLRYADLSSTAELRLVRVQGQAWLDWLLQSSGVGVTLPEVDLLARLRADPAKALEVDLDGIAQGVTVARGAQRFAASPVALEAKARIDATDAALRIERVAAGATRLAGGGLRYRIPDGALAGEVGFHADLQQALGYGRSLAPEALARIDSATGALDGRLTVAAKGDEWRLGVGVTKSDAAVRMKGMPGAFRLARATVEVDAAAIKARDVALSSPAGEVVVSAARYGMQDGAAAGALRFDLDAGQTLALVRSVLPDVAIVQTASGRLRGQAKGEWTGKTWSAALDIAQSDARVKLKPLPQPIRLAGGSVAADARGVTAEKVAISLPAGNLTVSRARYAMKGGAMAASAQFDLDARETVALVRSLVPDLDIVEAASGRLRGSASGELSGKSWAATLELAQSSAQAKLKPLPEPVSLQDLALRATQSAITLERASARLLDAQATVSGTISDYTGEPRIRASVRSAEIGERAMAWIWQTAALPAGFEPRTPLRLAVPHFAWGPKSALEVRADARFASGPVVAVDLSSSPQALDVRRVHVKDAMSDAAVVLRMRGGNFDGSYSGTLDSRTLGSMLKSAAAPAGAMTGELAFVYDHDQPRRTTVRGELRGERVDLSWLAGGPASLERLELTADGDSVQVGEASVEWAGQRATLRGQLARTASGPVIDAEIESPGIVVDALLPKTKPAAEAKPADKKAQIWPLPLTGRIALRTPLLQYDRYKVAPLRANVTLEQERAVLNVLEALVCGLAVPMTVEATPKGYAMAAQIAAQKQKLEESVQCLAGEKLILTGPLDLRLDVRTQGQPAELVRNLKGTVSADVRNGTVTQFALLGNILSMQNVAALVTEGPQLGRDAFPFRQLTAKGRLDGGYFYLEEGVFHSNAIGLGANGWISLTDYSTRLTVLVAPLALVDEAVRKLPILGYVIGGAFTSLPVAVNGDIRNPLVVPLGPGAITNEVMGILTRTITLPGKMLPSAK